MSGFCWRDVARESAISRVGSTEDHVDILWVAVKKWWEKEIFMGDTQRFPMTIEGERRLREELTQLKSVERPRIIAAIAEAREHGDLKENAEYHAAREQQSFVEGRINEIEAKLSQAQVIDISQIPNEGRVLFGVQVSILNVGSEEEKVYQIVGDDEADTKVGKISVNSPLARALIGKEVGEVVKVNTPNGVDEYEIQDVAHP